MPLNSFKCEQCNKYNNYVVALDEDGGQEVICSMCGNHAYITKDALPERVLESIQQLQDDYKAFDDAKQVIILNDDESIVDELLSNMESAFQDVKNNLVIGNEDAKMDLNIEAIADAYAPIKGIVDEKSENLVTSMMRNSTKNWKRDAVAAAADKASEYVNNDNITGRVLQYIANKLESGESIEELLNPNAMQAAGLSKQDVFILKQIAKSNKLNEIVNRYLN